MNYRKKSPIVEVFRNGSRDAWPNWLTEAWYEGKLFEDGRGYHIRTPECVHDIGPNDYIIKGPNDEIYPCEAKVFLELYEEIDAPVEQLKTCRFKRAFGSLYDVTECSNCQAVVDKDAARLFNYCPHCGAKKVNE